MPFRLLLIAVAAAFFLLGSFTPQLFDAAFNKEEVRQAARIAGLEFDDAEIELLLPGLEENLEAYQALRDISIDNSVSPALVFNPLPAGYTVPAGPDGVRTAPVEASLPGDVSELAFYSVRQLGQLLREGQISSEALTRLSLERLAAYDSTLYCVITLFEEAALEQARRADAELAAGIDRGPLHGIPYGAKDLLATDRGRTTWGATPFQDQSFDYNATVVEKLDSAGAVLVAKLTLGALAWGDVWYGGQTRNPWHPETGSSGSSAGSASAVAAGLVPFAIGTETLGSIVSPSTVCGTTGLRPTFGRVSRHGAMALSWSMDKIGPITRSAEDALLVLDAIRGADGKDASVIEAPLHYTATQKRERTLRVGYLQESFAGDYPFKTQDSTALGVLRTLGYELIPIELPEMPPISFVLSVEAAAAFDELTRSNRDTLLVRQVKNAWPNVFRQARLVPAVEYVQANRARTQLIEKMEEVFREIDVYVHPSWASPSLRITNYTGHPCIVVPNGFPDAYNGLPSSISFTGKLFGEADLVGVAQAFQEATEWADRHPEGF